MNIQPATNKGGIDKRKEGNMIVHEGRDVCERETERGREAKGARKTVLLETFGFLAH